MIPTKHHIFCIHCEWSLCQPQDTAQAFICFRKLTIACASFSLSIKRRADVMSAFFNLSKLCCFGNYQKNMKNFFSGNVAYVIHDITSSNRFDFI